MSEGQASRPAPWDEATAASIVAARGQEPGAMLPILHDLQAAFGYVDAAAVPIIADRLNVSRAEVHGVVSFYHDFRDHPAGRHVLKICRGEACQAVGCRALVDHLDICHGLATGATTADGDLTVEEIFCLGNCALGPSVLYDGELIGRVDAKTLDGLVAEAREPR
ncbi:MAG: formate dehydrogenase subunit gamma [Ancalomicrobiaceae bacterium]|nr:formate dehydrogenase subunit gamma [Ancalomicrobiaceae bacterium]